MENVVNHPRLDDMEAVRMREERRRARVYQEQTAEFNTWFDAKFKAAVAENSPFNNDLTDAIREAFDEFRKLTTEQVLRAVDAARTDFAARLMEAERGRVIAEIRERAFAERAKEAGAALTELRATVRSDVIAAADDLRVRVRDTLVAATVELRAELESTFEARLSEMEKRAEAAEERAGAAETALTELHGAVRNDVIRLSDDFRERTREAVAAPAAELRADVGEKFAALRSEFGEKITALSARPNTDQGQVDRTVEAAVARTRVEMRAEFDRALDSRLKERERAFEERIAEFERRTVAADERARSLEAVVIELRRQLGDDAIRLADDLRARTRDALGAAAMELRSELESKFEARLKAAAKRAEAAEARALAAETAQAELRAVIRDDAIQVADDLRARAHDALAAATVELRADVGERFAALRSEFGEKIAALSARPNTDQGQVDRTVEAAVARTRIEMRAEFDHALEAQRGEFALQLQALKERVGDVAGQSSYDQSQIERAAASAAETAVAQLRVGLDNVVEAQTRAFDARLAESEARLNGVPGKLSIAKEWREGSVTYEAQIVTHNGATFQATRDTAKTPGVGEDWHCLAGAGRDGRDGADGQSLGLRGVYDVNAKYAELDVVIFGDEPFLAMRDDPGLCPGDGWQLLAPRGKAGEKGASGPRGQKGDRGPPGAKIEEWRINREHFIAVPFYDDGTAGPPLRLRELFQEFIDQTG
jgi:hypothetical protein